MEFKEPFKLSYYQVYFKKQWGHKVFLGYFSRMRAVF